VTLALARVRTSWWLRLLARFRRAPTEYCARCGCVRDNGQRLPRGTRTVCRGIVTWPDWTFCVRLGVQLG
jgi:hypothetical protein